MTPNRYLPWKCLRGRPPHLDSQQFRSATRTCAVRLLMRQTACAWRFLPDIIGGGTWEGAPMPGMRRREFVSLFGAAAIWPAAARGQQPPVIGFLHSHSRDAFVDLVPRFRQGLKDAGYVEGQNVTIEYRWAE